MAGASGLKMKLGGAYKEKTWELIVWSIIRGIFIIMIIVEVIITILVFTQRYIVTHVSTEHRGGTSGAPYPNLLLCPWRPINASHEPGGLRAPNQVRQFLLAHASPTKMAGDNPATVVAQWSPQMIQGIVGSLSTSITNENYTYTQRLKSLYDSTGYQCSSVISRCELSQDDDAEQRPLDCCQVGRVVPTYYGPCLYLALEELPARQLVAGPSGGLRLTTSLANPTRVTGSSETQDVGFYAYLLDRPYFYPAAAINPMQPGQEYWVNAKASRQYILSTGQRDEPHGGTESPNWDESWEDKFRLARGRRSQYVYGNGATNPKVQPVEQSMRRDCALQCQTGVIVEQCGCLPFYVATAGWLPFKPAYRIDMEDGRVPVCNITLSTDCVAVVAPNVSSQLRAQYFRDDATDDTTAEYESVNSILNVTDRPPQNRAERLKSQWRRFQKWWVAGFKGPKDCVTTCQGGDIVTSYASTVNSVPLRDTGAPDAARMVINLAYVDMSMTVYRESYNMTFFEMLWVLGTSVAIWVVLYHIIKAVYMFMKQVCHCGGKKRTGGGAEGEGAGQPDPGDHDQPTGRPRTQQAVAGGSRPTTSSAYPAQTTTTRPNVPNTPLTDNLRSPTSRQHSAGGGPFQGQYRINSAGQNPASLPPIQQPGSTYNNAQSNGGWAE